jgi:hypothetical protein
MITPAAAVYCAIAKTKKVWDQAGVLSATFSFSRSRLWKIFLAKTDFTVNTALASLCGVPWMRKLRVSFQYAVRFRWQFNCQWHGHKSDPMC